MTPHDLEGLSRLHTFAAQQCQCAADSIRRGDTMAAEEAINLIAQALDSACDLVDAWQTSAAPAA